MDCQVAWHVKYFEKLCSVEGIIAFIPYNMSCIPYIPAQMYTWLSQ
jgi:hypothetical protein